MILLFDEYAQVGLGRFHWQRENVKEVENGFSESTRRYVLEKIASSHGETLLTSPLFVSVAGCCLCRRCSILLEPSSIQQQLRLKDNDDQGTESEAASENRMEINQPDPAQSAAVGDSIPVVESDVKAMLKTYVNCADYDAIDSFLYTALPRFLLHCSRSDLQCYGKEIVALCGLIVSPRKNTRDILIPVIHLLAILPLSEEDSTSLLKMLKLYLTTYGDSPDVIESVVSALGEFGCGVLNSEKLIVILISLLDFYTSGQNTIRLICTQKLIKIVKSRGHSSLPEFLNCYGSEIYPYIVRKVMKHMPSSPPFHIFPSQVLDLVRLISSSSTTTVTDFLVRTLPDTLPRYVLDGDIGMLDSLCAALGQPKPLNLLEIHYDRILMEILLSTDSKKQNEALHLLRSYSKTSLSDIFRFQKNRLVFLLVSELGNEDIVRLEKIKLALRRVISVTEQETENVPANVSADGHPRSDPLTPSLSSLALQLISEEEFQAILGKWLIWIMDEVNGMFYDKSASIEQKRKLIKSLIVVFRSARKQLNPLRPKIMTTLCLFMRKVAELRKETAELWLTFVRELQVSHLGPELNHVVVDLLQYVDKPGGDYVLPVFEYIFEEKRDELYQYYDKIPFFPLFPSLRQYRNSWRQGKLRLKNEVITENFWTAHAFAFR
tara:strand:- start:1902 stop:3890 length:1989 start_codon:yes stop_codon:yes gene_type:complete